mgnify:CR=1 FL=1
MAPEAVKVAGELTQILEDDCATVITGSVFDTTAAFALAVQPTALVPTTE